eukprot:CAMPEP_0170522090 /NCGR_PEP_ID=MMETSP0209-20121228/7545_1 /TAXON_ID=665100 ORGANISM="Litonotus pictus, Strain P1" /NCGR_SAMPLE_ID=MMETSP0209 /ASSEMBLY_ACC=CAM_ASM_000301 /LENGTH=555 /DNA_ID=CAMNT_0010809419 /DNA_START=69 /DNA_END=1735 /DNA_ORIENTATION=+
MTLLNLNLKGFSDAVKQIDPELLLDKNQTSNVKVSNPKYKENFEQFMSEYASLEELILGGGVTSDLEDLALVLSQFNLNLSNQYLRIAPLELLKENKDNLFLKEEKDSKEGEPKQEIQKDLKDLKDLFVDSSKDSENKNALNLVRREVPFQLKNYDWRALTFAYLENLILDNQVYALKQLVLDLYNYQEKLGIINTLCSNQIKETYNLNQVDFLSSIKILMLVSNCLENANSVEDSISAYTYLIKSMIYSRMFDIGLILFFQLKVCEYIAENKDSAIDKEQKVKLSKLFTNDDLSSSQDLVTEIFFKLINGKSFNWNLLIAFGLAFDVSFNVKQVYYIGSEVEADDIQFTPSDNGSTLNFVMEFDCIKQQNIEKDEVKEVIEDKEEKESKEEKKGEEEVEGKEEESTENQDESESLIGATKTNNTNQSIEMSNISQNQSNSGDLISIESSSQSNKILVTSLFVNNKEISEVIITNLRFSIFYSEKVLTNNFTVLGTYTSALGSFKLEGTPKKEKVEKENNEEKLGIKDNKPNQEESSKEEVKAKLSSRARSLLDM